jgi:hypothetical protein
LYGDNSEVHVQSQTYTSLSLVILTNFASSLV